jgi:hypothetical protein
VRVKSKWSKKDKTHSVEEVGGALAFIAWRIAQNILLDLENNDYQTDTQLQRLNIIEEILAFTIHIIDRMTINKFNAEERQRFMTELVMKTAKHMEDNKRDIVGPGEYKQSYIDLVNQRMGDYADFNYDNEGGGPSFPMRRFFGDRVSIQMGEKNRKWVADQMIEVEAPEILETLNRSVPNLFQ